jgi:hypothetical protein
MSPQERSEIARAAAQSRWDPNLPKAVSGGPDKPIRIAGIEVPCYVLDDGRRVIATAGMLDALQMARGGSMVRGMNRLELFVSRGRIRPFISDELFEKISNPVRFKIGTNVANGYASDTLIDLAEAVIKADAKGVLQPQQQVIAYQCKVITSALTRVGLVALIDEATGYQNKRAADELQRILEAYVLPEHRPWAKAIPEEFMREVNRIYGWKPSARNRGPRYAGKLIRKYLYEPLPKPVLPALDQLNPADANYRRKRKHHQHLTADMGLEHFRTQMIAVMTLLRASTDKNQFKALYRRAFGAQRELDLGDD